MLFLRTVAVHVCKPSLRCYLNFHGLSSHESVCSHICLFWGGEQHFSPCIYLASVVCSLLMFFLVSLGASLVNICMGNKNLTRSRTDFYSNTSSPRGRGWGGGFFYMSVGCLPVSPVKCSLWTIGSESGRFAVFHTPLSNGSNCSAYVRAGTKS